MPPQLFGKLAQFGLHPDPDLERLMHGLLPDGVIARARTDVPAMSETELREWVSTALLTSAVTLDVWWPADGVAVRMPRQVLLNELSDWWYPSQDDLVISDSRTLLLIDHEEVVHSWSLE
jgi:hypothetical protein